MTKKYSIIYFLSVFICLYLYVKLCKAKYNIYIELSAATLSYIIYLPIVVKSWNLIGYHVIVIIASYNNDKRIIYISKIIKNSRNEVILENFNTSISLHFISKISRIYGFVLSKRAKNNDFFILSDADMIPVSKYFFSDCNYNKLIIKSLSQKGYGYGNNRGRWPICYMVARKLIWNEILKDDIKSNNLKNILLTVIKEQFAKGKNYFENFVYMDEVYLRDKIKQWKKFSTNVLFHKRNFSNRINRDKWPKNIFSINKNTIIDIHLPRLDKNIFYTWKLQIMPLQLFLFNRIPFGLNYIKRILSYEKL